MYLDAKDTETMTSNTKSNIKTNYQSQVTELQVEIQKTNGYDVLLFCIFITSVTNDFPPVLIGLYWGVELHS